MSEKVIVGGKDIEEQQVLLAVVVVKLTTLSRVNEPLKRIFLRTSKNYLTIKILRAETTSISSARRSHADRNFEISSQSCWSSARDNMGDVKVIMSKRTISSFSRSLVSSHSSNSFCFICL